MASRHSEILDDSNTLVSSSRSTAVQREVAQLRMQIDNLRTQILHTAWENRKIFLTGQDSRRMVSHKLGSTNKSLRFFSDDDTGINYESEAQKEALGDVDYLYEVSYTELNAIFNQKFQTSDSFKEMVLVMNQNIIEYRFLTQAGLLK